MKSGEWNHWRERGKTVFMERWSDLEEVERGSDGGGMEFPISCLFVIIKLTRVETKNYTPLERKEYDDDDDDNDK